MISWATILYGAALESWNRVNTVIFFGKSGEFATNRRDQQQLGMLALHILQAALVYINTLMVQDILAEPEWQDVLTAEDRRGLTALFWAHVRPYGEITLNMPKRLASAPAIHPTSIARPPERAPVHAARLTLPVGWCRLP